MIKLMKNGLEMEVRTEVQASVFLSHGYEIVGAKPEPQEAEEKDFQYSRSEITRMNLADLKSLATELGLEVTEESTGRVLKEQIIEKLGL